MAVIDLSLVAANINAVIQAGFTHFKVYRSTTGATGVYTELTTSANRPLLAANKLIYEFIDPSGDSAYWYKTAFYSATGPIESSQSDAQQGSGDPALSILSVNDLLVNYLIGLDLTTPQGIPFPNSLYQYFIKAAVSWLEHRLDIPIRKRVILDEKHDYFREDYHNYMWTQLDFYPCISVEAMRIVLPGGSVAQAFDATWLNLDNDTGVLEVVPGSGAANMPLVGAAGGFIPYLSSARRVPNVIRVDYTAGFDKVPADIVELIGKTASFGPLNIAGDLLGGAGIASQSISIDGLSQSINTTSSPMFAGYGARLTQYNKEIKEQVPTLRRYYKGIGMRVA